MSISELQVSVGNNLPIPIKDFEQFSRDQTLLLHPSLLRMAPASLALAFYIQSKNDLIASYY